jgi:hypothetical protein
MNALRRTRCLWIAAGLTVVGLAGCGSSNGEGVPGQPAANPTAPTQMTTAAPSATQAQPPPTRTSPTLATPQPTGAESIPWSSQPTEGSGSPVGPQPWTLASIRVGRHSGYDRIAFGFQGGIPDYRVGYVDAVKAAESGQPIHLNGHAYLQVLLKPVNAHDQRGNPTVGAVSRQHLVGYPTLTAYALTGDFEGYVSVALGLASKARFRVALLPTSRTLYIDVQH